jgi:hypothetical protein
MRSTYRKPPIKAASSTNFVLRWDAIATCSIVASVSFTLGIVTATSILSTITPPTATVSVVTEDPVDWTTMPDPSTLRVCGEEDAEACYYPGIELGDACDWVNSPNLERTWFINCIDPTQNGMVTE